MSSDKRAKLLKFLDTYGVVRPKDIEAIGISGVYLNKLHREGVLERPSRGIYTIKGAKVDQNQTLVEACKRIPKGTVCLLSALQFHGLTTQLPFEVWLAIDVKAHRPQGDLPPVRICRFSKASLDFGVETHKVGSSVVKVYSPAKTVADCFKYRGKIGLDVAIEALRAVWSKKKSSMDDLHKAAKACRVANVMRPYLESLI
jgi:predicted transcriptional regulator of viral defense system